MKLTTRIISLVLTVCFLLSAVVTVSAKDPEEYLYDLRIVYADSYDEAQKILGNTEFKDEEPREQVIDHTANSADHYCDRAADS